MKKILTILVTIVLLHLSTQLVNAQSIKLGVWPPILQVMIKPGTSITQVYKIYNNGDPAIISSTISPFAPSDMFGNINLVDCTTLQVLGCESLPWFSFQNAELNLNDSFFLGSNREQEVVLKISVPPYASEGDYYNTILFTTQAPPGLGDTKTRAQASIGSNILITVSEDGNPSRSIIISEFTAHKTISILGKRFTIPIFDSFEEIPVSIKVNNTGNAYTNVGGSITLSGFPGLRSHYQVSPTNVLGGSGRTLYATPSSKLAPQHEKEGVPSLVLNKGFYIGRYKLGLDLESTGNKNISSEIYFYALPYKIIGLVFVTMTIIAIIRSYLRKK